MAASLLGLAFSLPYAIIFSTFTSLPTLAAKLNAKPLPSRFDQAPNPDQEPMPPSLWHNRRADYRDVQKSQKEEEEKRLKEEKEKQEKAKQAQVQAVKDVQQQAINANNQAVALGKAGRFADAIVQHEKACKIDPSSQEFKINLSAAYCMYGDQRLKAGDASGAAHLYRKSLVVLSNNALAGNKLSQAIKKLGMDPTLADNRIGLGDQLAAGGDLAGATLEYTLAMQLEPGAKTYTKMGDISVRYGQVQNALSWYRQATVKNPNYGPAHRGAGFAYMMIKDYTQAASSLRKAVIADPDDRASGQALVEIWRKQVASQPTLAENHLGLGTALQLSGDLDGAEAEYMKVEQLDRSNPQIGPARNSLVKARKHKEADKHREAAETFFSQGLKREALSELAQAAMMEPNNARYQFQLGEYLEAAGDYQNALAAYRKSVLIDPRNEEGARRMRELVGQLNKDQQHQQHHQNHQQQQQNSRTPEQTPPQRIQLARPQEEQPSPVAVNTNYKGVESSPYAGNFRTHDESPTREVEKRDIIEKTTEPAPTQAASTANNSAVSVGIHPVLKQAAELEQRGDFNGAVEALKAALPDNLSNPEFHHRIGMDLVNLGQTSEAISELRIASALDPANRIFADDLARVLKIHQKSLSSNGAGEGR